MNLTLLAAVALFATWGVLVLVLHLPSGWIHLAYAAAMTLLARRVLTGAPKFLS